MTVHAVFFLGQGGYAFSMPIVGIADKAKALGVETQVLPYSDYLKATFPSNKKIALIGYSLGVSAATYIQQHHKVDLLICIAASTLAENYPVNKSDTKRSILYMGTDFLSSAGMHDGYDEIRHVEAGFGIPVLSHLLVPTTSSVTNGVIAELTKLQGS